MRDRKKSLKPLFPEAQLHPTVKEVAKGSIVIKLIHVGFLHLQTRVLANTLWLVWKGKHRETFEIYY